MTSEPKEEGEFIQRYWVEIQNGRLAEGLSAQAASVEWGLGPVYSEVKRGLIRDVQSELPYLFGRVQLDLLSDQRWVPQFTVGVPLSWQQFKFHPHLGLTSEKHNPVQPPFGVGVQYVF